MLSVLLRVSFPFLVALGLGGHYLAKHTHERFTNLRDRVESQCKEIRRTPGHDLHVCVRDEFATPVVPQLKVGREAIEEAKKAHARGDLATARARVDEVVERVRGFDARPTLLAELIGASLATTLLDFVEAHPTDFDVKGIASRLSIWGFAHPIEGQRLQSLWSVTHELETAGPFGEAYAALTVNDIDASYHEVERAVLADDAARCQRVKYGEGLAAIVCDKAPMIVRLEKRLERLRG